MRKSPTYIDFDSTFINNKIQFFSGLSSNKFLVASVLLLFRRWRDGIIQASSFNRHSIYMGNKSNCMCSRIYDIRMCNWLAQVYALLDVCVIHLSLHTAYKIRSQMGSKCKNVKTQWIPRLQHTDTPYRALFVRIPSNLIRVYLFYSLLLTLFLCTLLTCMFQRKNVIEYSCMFGTFGLLPPLVRGNRIFRRTLNHLKLDGMTHMITNTHTHTYHENVVDMMSVWESFWMM